MSINHLRKLDLNLLVALMALLEEQSVGAAATRLGLTQPGMSRALARLRETLGDPVLVRVGQKMAPTARALAIRPALERLLDDAARLMEVSEFDPARLDRVFRIAAVDAAIEAVLCHAVGEAGRQSPGCAFEFVNPGSDTLAALREGRLDFAVDVYPSSPRGYHYEHLYFNHYVVIARRCNAKGPPRALTRGDFTSLRHVKVVDSAGSQAEIEEALKKLRIRRQVAATASNFMSAASIVAQSAWIAVLPIGPATRAASRLPLDIFPLPMEVPKIPITLLWHERSEHDAASAWLRAQVRDAARRNTTPGRSPARTR